MISPVLKNYMREELAATPCEFERYMSSIIPWEDRLIGLVGPRGVGKSTLVKQQIIKTQQDGFLQLYVAADNSYFATHTLIELADEFVTEGGRRLIIDEIHKYHGWSQELKQIYDTHPRLNIIFTGSSVIDIRKGGVDLSRRALIFEMQGLSFREYLELFEGISFRAYSMEEIRNNGIDYVPEFHPLPFFRQYLADGYYPFGRLPRFDIRMQQIVSQTLDVDIPTHANMTPSTARKLKQMLMIISESAPFKPNMLNLSVELKISKNDVPDYLVYLERAGMLALLRDSTAGMRGLGKLEKVFIDNPNLMAVLSGGLPDKGNIRETFFLNQMRVNNNVVSSRISDFEIDGVTYEIGGAGKGRRQLREADRGIVVRDDIEYGSGNIVPLWTFGMNY